LSIAVNTEDDNIWDCFGANTKNYRVIISVEWGTSVRIIVVGQPKKLRTAMYTQH
jgi:hypothetical protein